MSKKGAGQERKFSADYDLQAANLFPVFTKSEEELDLINRHQYPRNYEVMKEWAQYALESSGIPIPTLPTQTWFVFEEDKWIELSTREDRQTYLRKGSKMGTVASFLKDKDPHSIEYAAIQILESIEYLEDGILKNEILSATHHAIQATASYMEARCRMSHSSPILEKTKRWIQSRKQKRKDKTDKKILAAYYKLKEGGQTSTLQKRIAREAGVSTKTVQRCLSSQGLLNR